MAEKKVYTEKQFKDVTSDLKKLRAELAKLKKTSPGAPSVMKKAKGGMVKKAKGGMVKKAKGGMIKKMNGGVVRRSKGSMVKKAKGGMVKRVF